MTTLVLYHKSCMDGFLASLFAKKRYPKAELVPVEYGKDPPSVEGKDVFILDFCYDRSQLLELRSKARSLKVLDHHITAMKKCSDLDFCLFDMEKCGASLSFHYFKDPSVTTTPLLLDLVEFRDLGLLFQSKNPLKDFQQRYDKLTCLDDSNSLNLFYSYLDSFDLDYQVFDQVLEDLEDSSKLEGILKIGEALRRYQERLTRQLLKNKQSRVLENGLELEILNSPLMQSELGNLLALGQKVGVVWYQAKDQIRFSLRSRVGGPDVSQLASSLGGGGHKNAAGFSGTNLEILDQFTNLKGDIDD